MEWDFPSNGGGETDGFNNSSIDTFIGRRVFSLVRETIQNSMDARQLDSSPVRISFTLSSIKNSNAKGVLELLPFLALAKKTSLNQHEEGHPGTAFFDRAIKLVESEKSIPFFGIHDFNTTGLTGPTEQGAGKPGAWLALVKGSGLSIKRAPGALGSFGHGSKAPFAVSQLRSVFYLSEIVSSGMAEQRFQGKSILQSMQTDSGEMTQGTGYFGHKKMCMPVLNSEIPEWATGIRKSAGTGTGTSLFVPFPELGTNDVAFWRDIQISVLSNFYYAILKGNLEVTFNETSVIDSGSLRESLDRICSELSGSTDDESQDLTDELRSAVTIQYPSLGKSGTLFSTPFGEVDWFMRVGESIDWRAVGVARQNGMLISRRAKNLEKFAGTKPFDIFICVVGKSGSQILRAAENPAHTEFEFDRITDPKDRRSKFRAYTEFTKEMRELIRTHAAIDVTAEAFTSDLDDFFGAYSTSSDRDGDSEKSVDLYVGKSKRVTSTPGSPVVIGGDGSDEGSEGSGDKGPENDEDGGKPNKGAEGKTGGKGREHGISVIDPRIVRSSLHENVVQIYFTPTVRSPFQLSLYRSGESDRESVKFRAKQDKDWKNSLQVASTSKIQRLHIEVELSPEEAKYVHEVVVFLGQ